VPRKQLEPGKVRADYRSTTDQIAGGDVLLRVIYSRGAKHPLLVVFARLGDCANQTAAIRPAGTSAPIPMFGRECPTRAARNSRPQEVVGRAGSAMISRSVHSDLAAEAVRRVKLPTAHRKAPMRSLRSFYRN
jgi:hypothetical protein